MPVENRSGRVSVRRGEEGRVRVEARVETYADSESDADYQADRVKRGITLEGDRVIVRTPELLRPAELLQFFERRCLVDSLREELPEKFSKLLRPIAFKNERGYARFSFFSCMLFSSL